MKHKYLFGFLALFSPTLLCAHDVFGQRYCEIVESRDYLEFKVFHKDKCPASWWQHLSVKQLQNQNHVSFIHLNGPRIWLADEVKSSHASKEESHQFNGMNLELVAKFKPEFQMILKKHGPYTDYHMHRFQSYAFHKGREIIELISPQGKVYVLHSLSLKHESQSPNHLDRLLQRIHPPKGWHLKHGNLSIEHALHAEQNKVHVIQDELENTYQLSDRDWLKV